MSRARLLARHLPRLAGLQGLVAGCESRHLPQLLSAAQAAAPSWGLVDPRFPGFAGGRVTPRWIRASATPMEKVVVPSMGESISEGGIAEVPFKVGDVVQDGDIVAQVETDKVTIDVKYSGPPARITEMLVKAGDSVTVGQAVCHVSTEGVDGAEAKPKEPKAEKKGQAKDKPAAEKASGAQPAAQPAAPSGEPARAGATKPFGGEKPAGAPGPAAAASAPSPAPAAAGRVERRVKMTRLRMRVAERLKGAQNTYAMLTTFNEVDMTALMDMRNKYKDAFQEKHGVKLGFMSAFVAAASDALKHVPAVNAVIDGDEIVYRDYNDVSVAVATPKGLVVPVIRSVDNMKFAEIEKAMGALGVKARDGTLSIDEMAGGTFTISNGGVFGSMLSTPIINPPQSAIMGMHSINQRPVVIGGAIVPRPMMYLALTYDHRLVDGREAVTFLKRVKEVIEDPVRLLLEV